MTRSRQGVEAVVVQTETERYITTRKKAGFPTAHGYYDHANLVARTSEGVRHKIAYERQAFTMKKMRWEAGQRLAGYDEIGPSGKDNEKCMTVSDRPRHIGMGWNHRDRT